MSADLTAIAVALRDTHDLITTIYPDTYVSASLTWHGDDDKLHTMTYSTGGGDEDEEDED